MERSSTKVALAQRVAERLGEVPDVVAVALGGSLARGRALPNSDIDLGIYYRPARPPSIAALRQLAAELDDSGLGDAVTDFGGWGPWVNGGAWLTIKGHRLDWIYRDLDLVERVFDACERGEVARHIQAGHPHGFHTHNYLGEVHYGRSLVDPAGVLAHLKGRVDVYPERLAQALIESYSWRAYTALDAGEKSLARVESVYVAGCFFECGYCLVQVLFALNRRFFVNEKGALGETRTFDQVPPGFADTVHEVLSHPGESMQVLQQNWKRMWDLAYAVGELVGHEH
ncbi:MAG: hypothetical protein AVDCRST_MAG86-4337 [uncultured Truepera sp.]|uniref:Uncharacterized protein n=1 Tax=uncultured Truepera sp. TaxID=543023 RepID=A0A6J4VTP5_9DEIN|nr:MAG: hypothetical protein AVDCRST_MAG86-4337 [uncultured Truepera sp.]